VPAQSAHSTGLRSASGTARIGAASTLWRAAIWGRVGVAVRTRWLLGRLRERERRGGVVGIYGETVCWEVVTTEDMVLWFGMVLVHLLVNK
jgi:hypothetical protein